MLVQISRRRPVRQVTTYQTQAFHFMTSRRLEHSSDRATQKETGHFRDRRVYRETIRGGGPGRSVPLMFIIMARWAKFVFDRDQQLGSAY